MADAASRARLHVDEEQSPRQPDLLHGAREEQGRLLDKDEHDVFGDGSVIIKAAPGHTPGHQVLILRLASTGRMMLSGDLYHYPQERTFNRAPPDNEFNVQQSAASRRRIEEYLKATKISCGSSTTSTRLRS